MMTEGEKDAIDSILGDYHKGNVNDMIAFATKCFNKLPKNLVTQEVTDRYNRLIVYLETKKR